MTQQVDRGARARRSDTEHAEQAWDRADGRYTRQVSAAAEAGRIAIRMALIVNAAAALAVFVFLASISQGGALAAQLDGPVRIARAIKSFAIGATLAAAAAGTSFVLNQLYAVTVMRARYIGSYPYIRDTAASLRLRRTGLVILGLTIGLIAVSLAFFLVGLASLRLR